MTKKTLLLFLLSFFIIFSAIKCFAQNLNDTEKEFQAFLDNYLKTAVPLNIKAGISHWDATATGNKEDYDKYEKYSLELIKLYSNKDDFAKLKKIKSSENINNPELKRELTIVYNLYAENQTDPALLEKMVKLSTKIEKTFYTYRGKYNGKEVSDNELLEVLAKEKNSNKRKEAWEAQKSVAKEVSNMIIELVKLRNESARSLGYNNYYEMSLILREQDQKEVLSIFDKLAKLTDEPFKKEKDMIDKKLSNMWLIDSKEMMPWHYQDFFFQEGPELGDTNLDSLFEDKDVTKIIQNYYKTLNLNSDNILKRSDLYERNKKYQHAYCTDIDRSGDVRIMCNMRNNAKWAGTLMHELGHAVYSYYYDPDLPYLLRDSAHIFTTEAIAMMIERNIYSSDWLINVLGADKNKVGKIVPILERNLRTEKLVFSRWSQVMVRFEKALYENPDQDLNKLWWDLVERYQFVKRPIDRNMHDWASKIHFTTAPCYYHNYLLGDLFASQLAYTISTKVMKKKSVKEISFVGNPEIGAFLISKVFYPGAKWEWNVMIKNATGQYLDPKFWVEEFVQK